MDIKTDVIFALRGAIFAACGSTNENRQKSEMPVGGKSALLKIRIPSWTCDELPELKLNGKSAGYKTKNGYALANAKVGNNVVFNIPLKPKRVYSHRKVMPNRRLVSFAHGPLVYCAESIDNKDFGSPIKEFAEAVKGDSKLEAKFEKNLLGGIYAICMPATNNRGELKTLKLIPYFARENREPPG